MTEKPLKRGIITEELVELTGDVWEAVLLRQMLYWFVRCSDIDRYVEREMIGAEDAREYGWFHKSAGEFKKEALIPFAENTIRQRIQNIVKAGWAGSRRNPTNSFDRRLQYRPNVKAIEADLSQNDYSLDTVLEGGGCEAIAPLINPASSNYSRPLQRDYTLPQQ